MIVESFGLISFMEKKYYIRGDLRHLLKAKGVQISELAEKHGWNPNNIRNWDEGLSNPRINNIRQLCDFFGLMYAYDEERNEYYLYEPKETEEEYFNELEKRHLEAYKTLPKDAQKTVDDLIRNLENIYKSRQ